MTEKELKSKNKKRYWLPYFMGILLFVFMSIYCYRQFTPNNHPIYISLIFCLIFLIGALICFYMLISIKNYCIEKNRLIVTAFGKVKKSYNLNEVESWTEKQIKGKYDKWEDLTLYIKTGEKLKISSSNYDNYFEIKNEVTKNKIRNLKLEELAEKKIGLHVSIAFILVGILFFIGAYNALHVKYIDAKNIVVFGDKTSRNIELIKGKHNSVLIKLENFPDLKFNISSENLKATFVDDLINEVKEGDSIFIGIDKTEYRRKIIKVDSLSFADKYFFNENISVESIASEKNYYLKLSEVNAIRSNDKFGNFAIFLSFGLLLMSVGIFGLQKSISKGMKKIKLISLLILLASCSNDQMVRKSIDNNDISIKWYYYSLITNDSSELIEVKKGDSSVIIYESVGVITDIAISNKKIILKQFEPSNGIIHTKKALKEVFGYKIVIDTNATYDDFRYRPNASHSR